MDELRKMLEEKSKKAGRIKSDQNGIESTLREQNSQWLTQDKIRPKWD